MKFGTPYEHKINDKCFTKLFEQYGFLWQALCDPLTELVQGQHVFNQVKNCFERYTGQDNVVPIVHLEAPV